MNHSKKLKENDVVVFKEDLHGLFNISEGDVGIVRCICEQEFPVRVQIRMNFGLYFKTDEIEKIGEL